MARPKSEDKRTALLDAAVRVFVTNGLSASTALIASEAGVANGTLFTYFPTKAELLQQLYLTLKAEMARASLHAYPENLELREQLNHVWSNWMEWAAAHPDKLHALTLLAVSEDITSDIRDEAALYMARIIKLLEQIRQQGQMRDVPMAFVGEILSSLGNATMGFMVKDPERADEHCRTGFEALWRVVG